MEELLQEFELPDETIKKFIEEGVDLIALEHLIEDDLAVLIPSIGVRAKFRVKLADWKKKLARENTDIHVEEDIFSTPSCHSFGILESAPIDIEEAFKEFSETSCGRNLNAELKSNDESLNEELNSQEGNLNGELKSKHNNPLYELLNNDRGLKHLLKKKKLTKSERSSVARLIIVHLVNTTPGGILKPAQINEWADIAIKIFCDDDISFYFYTVPASANDTACSPSARSLPSSVRRYYGCLWDRWNNYRKILRETNSIAFTKKRQSSATSSTAGSSDLGSEPDTENNSMLSLLKIIEEFQGTEITEYVKDAWKKTRENRLKILAISNVEEYTQRFPALKTQNIAEQLIDIDCNLCSPPIDGIFLAEKLKYYQEAIIQLAREKSSSFRDKTQKSNVNKITELLTSGNENEKLTVALLLLPYLFSSGGKLPRGGRTSRAEAAQAFILLAPSLAEAEDILEKRRQILKTKNGKLQPLVLAIGNTWKDVRTSYVYIDKPLYSYSNIIDAVQWCFKSFFSLDLNYPTECEHIWLLIQKFFGINLPTDKTILSVKQVLASLNSLPKSE